MRPQRVLLVTPQPFFEDRGTPIAVACTARALAEYGREVDVLAFPLGRTLKMPRVRVHRAGNPCRIRSVPIGFSARKLVLDLSLLASFRRLLEARRYDIVHAVEEAAGFAAALCPRRNVPFIYDMASAIPDEVAGHPVLGMKPVQALLGATERRVVANARHVICSRGLGRRVEAMDTGTPVTEWRFPAFERVSSPHAAGRLRASLKLSTADRVVLYAGNFSRYQGVDLLIDAFARIAGRDPRLVLVCVGAENDTQAETLRARLPSRFLDRLRIVPRVERSEMPLWLSMADCLTSPRLGGANMPLKVFEYLAAGKPIVATRHASHEAVLGDGRAIICEGETDALAAGISRVFDNPQASHRMAENARGFAREHHGWDDFARFVNGIYDAALAPEYGPPGRDARH